MTKRAKLRTLWIGGVFTLFFVVLVGKMYYLQVVSASGLMEKAEEMWEKDKVLQPVRGSILDRNDHILAEDGPSYTVIVNPQAINVLKQERAVAQGLSSILGKPESEMMDLVTKKRADNGKFYQWVEVRSEGWKIDNDKADEIMEFFDMEKPYDNRNNLNTRGIYLEETQKRYYPSNKMAAHVLGYFDKNGKAVGGLESMYNNELSGKPGRIITEKDRMGYDLPDGKSSYEPAVDGKTIQLTIDQQIQSYLETAMEKSYQTWKPKSMSAIAVNPKTMEILAMANFPNFNPASYWDTNDQKDFYNHAIGSMYEPGSTFKLVTLAGAVEEGLFNPTETFKSGSINILGDTLHDWNGNGWGSISYLDGLKRSSNVAFVKLGYEKLKPDKLKDYIARFGFGEKTGIDLPGEAKGLISFRYPVEYATATYGQGGVSVTGIQQAAAYAAIANGGKLMKPYIVKSIKDTRTGEVLQTTQPQVVRQVVSPATAQKVTEYLEQVVSDQAIGTGKNAYIEGYRVAGKTGTANVVINGKYSDDTWLTSFIGYAPVEDPQVLIAIVVDQADLKGDFHEGSKVAPIIFKEVMSQSLRYLGVSAKLKTEQTANVEKKFSVPDLINQSVADAKKSLNDGKIAYMTIGKGAKILAQYPVPGTEMNPSQRMFIVTEPVEEAELPDLKGKSLRDSLEICSYMKIDCQVSGEGYVVSQTLSAEGDKKTAKLELKPWLETAEASAGAGATPTPGKGSGTSATGGAGATGKTANSVNTAGATPKPGTTPTPSPTPTPTPSGKKP